MMGTKYPKLTGINRIGDGHKERAAAQASLEASYYRNARRQEEAARRRHRRKKK